MGLKTFGLIKCIFSYKYSKSFEHLVALKATGLVSIVN
jgi:hypothetical protein